MSRGFFAIGIVNGKTPQNLGTLWRTGHLYEAAFLFTIGRRYEPQSSDTPKTIQTTPLFHFHTIEDLHDHLPRGCLLVGRELDQRATPLANYTHPERACYLLGAEDHGLSTVQRDSCHQLIQIESLKPQSMNVAVAGSVVMYDRHVSRKEVSP